MTIVTGFSCSDMNHLYALLEYAKEAGVENCFIHGILDGEDAPHGVYTILVGWCLVLVVWS